MPMTPRKGESQSDFMARCMKETFTGDREQDQAVAICMDYWRAEHGGKKPSKAKQDGDEDLPDDADIPEPDDGESYDDFMERCMDELNTSDANENAATDACNDAWENRQAPEYADTGYQADGKKRFRINTTDQVRLAWSAAHGKKAGNYTEAQLGRIRARIAAAWKAKIDASGPPAPTDAAAMKVLRQQVVRAAKEYAPGPERGESHDTYIDRCVAELVNDRDMDEDEATQACQLTWDENRDDLSDDGRSADWLMHKTHATNATGMEFILSDATPDRFGDVVEPAGWETESFLKNPIALFNHDKNFVIGTWQNLKTSDKDLRGHLRLAPKGTSPRIDEIRRLVEADILRAVSVGFRPLEEEPINPKDMWGGTRYKKHELVETSLVAVPANPNALAVAKSLNISPSTVRLVFGEHASKDTVRREFARGEHADDKRESVKSKPASMPKPTAPERKDKPMLLSQRIIEAEKGLLTMQDNLDKHVETIDDAAPTEEQMVLTEDLTAKIETAKRHLTNLKAIETKNAAKADDLSADKLKGSTAFTRSPPGLILHPKKVEPLDYMFRAAVVRCMSKSLGQDVDATRRRVYGDDEVTRVMCDLILKAASAPAETTVTGWAAELVRTIWADWMQVLLPFSVYPALAAKGLALTFGANGRIIIPTRSLTPSISGSFVAEGAPIPVRQGQFLSQTLTPKKLAVITTWTREMEDYSIPAIEGLLRQAVIEDTAISIDAFLLSTNAATTVAPPGLRSYQAGLTAAAGAGTFYANFIADYTAMYNSLISLTNGNVRSPVLIINPAQSLQISMMQPPAAAAPLLPFTAMVDGGRILKADLIESANVPARVAIMVDAADFTTAGVEGPRMEISDQATLHMEDTTPLDIVAGPSPGTPAFPVKSMWQTDSLALRLVQFLNWVMRRPVVAWTSTTLWG